MRIYFNETNRKENTKKVFFDIRQIKKKFNKFIPQTSSAYCTKNRKGSSY